MSGSVPVMPPAADEPREPVPTLSRRTDAALRPRALPTDTSVRFLLLVAAVFAASLYLYQALWFVVRGERFLDVLAECGFAVDDFAAGSVSDTSALLEAQRACRAGVSGEQSAFALAGAATVLGAAYVAYRLLPRWRERRAHLVPLDPTDGAALQAEVEALARQAGVDPAPAVLVDATNPGVQAFVYGTAARPRLGITGGLVVQQLLDPPGFRAVLRHELAHVANRDVGWTYYTVTVWWAFVALALAPVVAVFAVSDPQYVLRLGWRTALLAMLVLLVRTAVLRAREAFADARAAEWGPLADLDRVLAAQPPTPRRRRSPLRRHPPAAERRRLLASPDGLFRADAFIALAAGVAGGTTFASLRGITSLLPLWAATWGPALLVAPLLAAVLCVAAWRCALRATVRGVDVRVAGPLAAGVGVGLAAGPMLAFEAALGGIEGEARSAAGYLVWAALTVALVGLVARYAADAGRVAVEAAVHRRSPWPVLLPHAVAVTASLAALLAVGQSVMRILTSFGPGPALASWQFWAFLPPSLGPGDDGLPLVAVAALMVAAPLLARGMLPRPAVAWPAPEPAGEWPWRAEVPPVLPVPRRPSIGPVLAVGALAGAVAVAAHVLGRLAGRALLDDQVWGSDAYLLALGFGTLAAAATAAVAGAAGGAVVLPPRWWPLGGLGAVAAFAVATTGILAAAAAAGCGLLPSVSEPDCGPPTMGELSTYGLLPASLAVAGVLVAPAVVGAVRAGARGRPGVARPAGRLLIAAVVAVAPPTVAAAWLVTSVVDVEAETVAGPGYEIVLPGTWQAQDVAGGAPLLSTLDQTVRVALVPVPGTAAPVGSATVDVGGIPARFVGSQPQGILEIRGYDLTGAGGSYRLVVVGRPDVLDAETDGALRDLLEGVRWAGAGPAASPGFP